MIQKIKVIWKKAEVQNHQKFKLKIKIIMFKTLNKNKYKMVLNLKHLGKIISKIRKLILIQLVSKISNLKVK